MLKFSRIARAAGLAVPIAAAVAAPAAAQTYPNANVKLIVPVPAGGLTTASIVLHSSQAASKLSNISCHARPGRLSVIC